MAMRLGTGFDCQAIHLPRISPLELMIHYPDSQGLNLYET